MTEPTATPQVNIDPQFTVHAPFVVDGTQSWVFNADEIQQNDDAIWLVKNGDIAVAVPAGMYLVYRNDALVNTVTAPVSATGQSAG